MGKLITDDCMKSFITNHFETADLSSVMEGGAL